MRTPVQMVGHLRERVALQSAMVAPNSVGDDVETFSTFATVFGRMSVRGDVRNPAFVTDERAARETVTRRWQLTIRYRSDVTAACRIVWNNRQFNILNVMNPDERQRYLTLDLVEFNAS